MWKLVACTNLAPANVKKHGDITMASFCYNLSCSWIYMEMRKRFKEDSWCGTCFTSTKVCVTSPAGIVKFEVVGSTRQSAAPLSTTIENPNFVYSILKTPEAVWRVRNSNFNYRNKNNFGRAWKVNIYSTSRSRWVRNYPHSKGWTPDIFNTIFVVVFRVSCSLALLRPSPYPPILPKRNHVKNRLST